MDFMSISIRNIIQNILIIILIYFTLISCSGSTNDSAIEMSVNDMVVSEGMYDAPTSMVSKSALGSPPAENSNSSIQPKIQVNGSLSLEVLDLDMAILKVKNIVSKNSGRITSSNSGYSNQPYVNINILIPSSTFEGVLDDIKQISSLVSNENIYTNDVTEEYIDIESRLTVMLETEKRFLSLLADAKKVEEIVQVETEIMRIRGEIDSLQGRIKYLTTTTDNSQLNIYMIEEMPISGGDDWNINDSFDDSLRNFVSFTKSMADFLIGIIVFMPILIILGLGTFFGYRFIKKKRSN